MPYGQRNNLTESRALGIYLTMLENIIRHIAESKKLVTNWLVVLRFQGSLVVNAPAYKSRSQAASHDSRDINFARTICCCSCKMLGTCTDGVVRTLLQRGLVLDLGDVIVI